MVYCRVGRYNGYWNLFTIEKVGKMKKGQRVTLSVPADRILCRDYLVTGAVGTVLSVLPNTVMVRFDGAVDSDIVSPVFLGGDG